jgi:SAM-dependent methyltransferase
MLTRTESVNYWPQGACAKAFWSQHELPPYQELLRDTTAWLEPRPLEKWLDLGCGGGQLTRALWQASQGRLAEIVGVDCAAANAVAYERLRKTLRPAPREQRIRFVALDFSRGLPSWQDHHFDGVVSGLAIQYAESYCEETGRWTTDGYDRLLAEVHRVLRPGGRFVLSVNVPHPKWGRVAWTALRGVFGAPRPLNYLKKAWRLWRYGGWLQRESRRGRFHYLPLQTVVAKLRATGFRVIDYKLSFARQAYVLLCRKPLP